MICDLNASYYLIKLKKSGITNPTRANNVRHHHAYYLFDCAAVCSLSSGAMLNVIYVEKKGLR